MNLLHTDIFCQYLAGGLLNLIAHLIFPDPEPATVSMGNLEYMATLNYALFIFISIVIKINHFIFTLLNNYILFQHLFHMDMMRFCQNFGIFYYHFCLVQSY